ncbi:MAG: membrane bound O-acyl transferase family-domain-containing protein [Planctomycetes bacterium]|nr:membrane bound O-acyl transferase family-domain-containing protein [Planctomycetota bacterium]
MEAYLPDRLAVVLLACGAVLATGLTALVLGAHGTPTRSRAVGWALLAANAVGLERLLRHEPAGVRMLLLIAGCLLAMKALVLTEARVGGLVLPPARRFVFLLWVGMDPRPFAARDPQARPGAGAIMARGAAFLASGLALVALARVVDARVGATAILLVGLSLALHFGLLNVGCGLLRLAGYPVERPFDAPLLARNLTEFWGRRWNRPFSDMLSAVIYRPLRRRAGRPAGVLAAFALSGLLHEVAISVPVRAGFGLPLAYFVAHGGLVLLEGHLARRGRPIGGVAGRAWTLAWLAGPLAALFHPPFLRGVVWPLAGLS